MPGLIDFLKNKIESESFCNRHKKNPKDFTRKRALTFSKLIHFFVNLPSAAYEAELCSFNKSLHNLDIAEPIVTAGALTKAREKFEHSAFIELNEQLADRYYHYYNPARWNGFFLLAIDGTMMSIPKVKAIAEHFGQWNPRQGDPCPKARVSQLYDVLNRFTIDAKITPKCLGERELAAAHCRKLCHEDLLLLDRGYEGFWLFKLIMTLGANFCARVSCNKLKIVKSFVKSGESERIVKMSCTPTSALKCAQYDLDKNSIKLRLIRVELPSGEVEVLITSLTDLREYPLDQFADLYHRRWPIEEDYKLMKCRMQMENFSGKTVHSVYQDFHAGIFTKNLTSVLIRSVEDRIKHNTAGRIHIYKANFTNALAMMKSHVVVLFNRSAAIVSACVAKLQNLIVRVLSEVREGRSVPRNFKKKSRSKFCAAYKPIS